MSGHLLSLADLHAAAPGVLDVVFGRDGSFDDAPFWRGPVRLTDGRYVSMDWLLCQPWDLEIMHRMAAIDLRVPTAAARLAGLCAQALGFNADDGWRIVYTEHIGFELITARCTQFCESGGSRESWRFTGVPWRRGLPAIAGCSERWTCEMFLAALTLALAPKIAAQKVAP